MRMFITYTALLWAVLFAIKCVSPVADEQRIKTFDTGSQNQGLRQYEQR